MRLPVLLGHEGAGFVEEIGPGVTTVAEGDRVVIAWRAPCGDWSRRAGAATRGAARTTYGAAPLASCRRRRAPQPVLRCGTLSDAVVVHEACAVKVPEELPFEQACLLACGFSTGAGAALWTSPVHKGASVAVIGCGGVGLAVVQGAKLAGAARIVAIDVAREKLATARLLGATEVVDASVLDAVDTVREITGGVDFAFSAVGAASAMAQAVRMCGYAGTATLVGLPPPGAKLELDLEKDVFDPKITLAVTHGGDTIPQEDFPFLAQAALDGKLDLARFVTSTISLDEVPDRLPRIGQDGEIRTIALLLSEPAGLCRINTMRKCLAALALVLALTACASAGISAPKLSPVSATLPTKPATPWARQWVDTHGIEVADPARWKLNSGHCGTPQANTVLWNNGIILDCLTSQPRGLSVVEFGGVLNRPTGWYRRHATRVFIDGAEAFRVNAGFVAGSREVQLIFHHRGITVSVMSPNRALRRQILASVRSVKVNTDGCPTRPQPSYRTGSRPRSGRRFPPSRSHRGRWLLLRSGMARPVNRAGSKAAQRVAKVLNHAAWGSSRAPGGSIASSECVPSWHSFSIAYFEYAHRKPVAVTAHLDGCRHLGASNGKWGVRMSYAWVPTFWDNVAYYGSVADRWGCGC